MDIKYNGVTLIVCVEQSNRIVYFNVAAANYLVSVSATNLTFDVSAIQITVSILKPNAVCFTSSQTVSQTLCFNVVPK